MPQLPEVAELDGVEGSRTLGHRDAVPRDGVRHIIVVQQIDQRSALDVTIAPGAVGHLAVDCGFDVVVFEQVRGDGVDP